jgi:short-subunit dehydrogenase
MEYQASCISFRNANIGDGGLMSTALITGASGGIGLELAREFARDKYDLVLVARSADKLDHLKKELEKEHGITARVCVMDLADPSTPGSIYEFLAREKIEIDYLINNAGFGDYGFFRDVDWVKTEQMIQVNITALTHLSRLLLPDMIRRNKGGIMNVASTAGFLPGPLMSVYYATKAYVLSFSEALANELKSTGVKVSVLCPGPTSSGFQAMAGLQTARLIRFKIMASPVDVARYGYQSLIRNKTIAIPGLLNKMTPYMVRLMPRKVVTAMIRMISNIRN